MVAYINYQNLQWSPVAEVTILAGQLNNEKVNFLRIVAIFRSRIGQSI